MWARFDDQFWTHRKVIVAGNEATGAFVRVVCCCAQRLSNGVIDDATALLIAGRQKVLDRLVEVGMLERGEGSYTVHDWRDWQPSGEEVALKRSEVATKRAEAGRRGALARWQNGKPDGKPMANDVATPSQTDGPVPVPSEETPNGVLSGDGKPPADVEPVKLTEPPAKAAKKPRKEPRDPPPFSIGQAFEALASASNGRFAAGVERDWTQGIRIAVAKLIRQYPDLGAWKVVGEWLAAGGEHYRGVVGPSWAAGTTMANAMAIAMEWNGKGRGPVRPEPRSPGLFESQKPRGLATSTPARVLPAPPPKSLDEARAATARGLEATIAMKASLVAMTAAKEINHGS